MIRPTTWCTGPSPTGGPVVSDPHLKYVPPILCLAPRCCIYLIFDILKCAPLCFLALPDANSWRRACWHVWPPDVPFLLRTWLERIWRDHASRLQLIFFTHVSDDMDHVAGWIFMSLPMMHMTLSRNWSIASVPKRKYSKNGSIAPQVLHQNGNIAPMSQNSFVNNCFLNKRYRLYQLEQWRSEAKHHPGPTTKVSSFTPLKFPYKNLKWRKIIFRAYLKTSGLIKHFEDHNQTLTNWNGSCFTLSIVSLTFFCLSRPSSSLLFLIFLLSLHMHICRAGPSRCGAQCNI